MKKILLALLVAAGLFTFQAPAQADAPSGNGAGPCAPVGQAVGNGSAFQVNTCGFRVALPPATTHFLVNCYDGALGGQTNGATASTTNSTSTAHVQAWCSTVSTSPYTNTSATYPTPNTQKGTLDCPVGAPCIDITESPMGNMNLGGTCHPDQDLAGSMTELDFTHTSGLPHDNANRVSGLVGSATCNPTNPATRNWPNYLSANFQNLWRTYIRNYQTANSANRNNDYWFFSTANCATDAGSINFDSAGGGGGAPDEYQNESAITDAKRFFWGSMTYATGQPIPVMCNGVVTPPSANAQIHNLLIYSLVNFMGGSCENCIVNNTLVQSNAIGTALDTLATVTNAYPTKISLIISVLRNDTPGGTTACNPDGTGCGQMVLRFMDKALMWMSTDGKANQNVMIRYSLAVSATTTIAAYPEFQIVPHTAVRSMGCVGDTNNTNLVCGGGANGTVRFGNNGTGCTNAGAPDAGTGGAGDLLVKCGATALVVNISGTPNNTLNNTYVINGTTVNCPQNNGGTAAAQVTADVSCINGSAVSGIVLATANGATMYVTNKAFNVMYTETCNGNGGDTVSCTGTNSNKAAGVYVREFTNCTNWLTSIGVCAGIINATGTPYTPNAADTYIRVSGTPLVYTQTYGHYLAPGVGEPSGTGDAPIAAACSDTTGCPSGVLNPTGNAWSISSGTPVVPGPGSYFLFQ